MARRKNKSYSTLEVIVILAVIIFTIYTNLTETTSGSNVPTDDPVPNTVTENLEVQFIDVGQADSILIRSKDKSVLIDAGNNEDGPKLVEYLKGLGVTNFEYVIGTHAHEDHIGGMDDIIKNFSIGKFYMPYVPTTTKTFEDVLDSLEAKGYKFDTPKIGDKFTSGEGEYEILFVGDDEEDLNSTSIVVRLDHGSNSFLFTGDATSSVEDAILDKNIDVDVLKVAHHGSPYSTLARFAKKVEPKYAVISVGANNTYNHPSSTIIKRLELLGAKVYRTDLEGTIIMESDGNVLSIKTLKTETNG